LGSPPQEKEKRFQSVTILVAISTNLIKKGVIKMDILLDKCLDSLTTLLQDAHDLAQIEKINTETQEAKAVFYKLQYAIKKLDGVKSCLVTPGIDLVPLLKRSTYHV
jgi:hypothetical protein